MKTCPRCSTEHVKPGVYCSRKCANSRSFSDESIHKKSIANKNYYETLTIEQKEHIENRLHETRLNRQGQLSSRLFDLSFDELSYHSKRKRVFIEQDLSCGCCGLDRWLDTAITLELEHIDGNHSNNQRTNLIGLCPNCHSLTATWRGRKNNKDGVMSNMTILRDRWYKYKESLP